MVTIEKLSASSWDEFIELHNEGQSKHPYDKNFLEYYKKQNFLTKVLLKKFVKLFVYKNEYFGYIWHEAPLDLNIRVWSMYIREDKLQLLNENVLNLFDNSILTYDTVESSSTVKILEQLGFKETCPTLMMELDIDSYTKGTESLIIQNKINNSFISLNNQYKSLMNSDLINGRNVYYKIYKEGKDEELRCRIQNSIFASSGRTALSADDIYSDTTQDYYIQGMSLFIRLKDSVVGYGQIIHNRDVYTLVNFGIIPEFRGYGLGKLIINELILLSQTKGIKKINLRVEEKNKGAIKLYKWAGFKEKLIISSWDR